MSNYLAIKEKLINIKNLELSQLLDMTNDDSVEIRKGFYKEQNMQNMQMIYTLLLRIYVVVFVLACGMLFFHKESSMQKKFITICVLFIMPLLMTKLIILVVTIVQYSKNKIIPMIIPNNISRQY